MKRIFFALLSSGLILGLGLVTGILVARFLGPEQRGILASAVALCTMLAGVTSWSIADVLGRALSGREDKRFNLTGPYAVIVLGGLGLGLGVVALLGVFGWLLTPGADRLLISGLVILLIPLNHVSQTAVGLLQGNHMWNRWNIVRISPHLGYLVLLLSFFWIDPTLERVALAFVLSNAVPVAAGLVFAAAAPLQIARPSLAGIQRAAKDALKLHSGRMLQMIRANLDKVLIPLVFGPTMLGYYMVAMTLTTPLMAAATTVTSVYIPRIAAEQRGGSLAARRRTVCELAGLILLGIVFSIAYIWVSAPLVTLLFGSAFEPALAYVPLTIAISAGYCTSKLLETFLVALGHTGIITLFEQLPLAGILGGLLLFRGDFSLFLIGLAATAWLTVLLYAVYFLWRIRPIFLAR